MKGKLTEDAVYVDAPARERFYDTHGYGSPDGDGLKLAPVEACYLLHRDDLDSINGMDFSEFLAHETLVVDFVVYADLRNRGYYLGVAKNEPYEFTVYPRGKGPWDNAIAHRIRVIDERELIKASSLINGADTLAIVDEEEEISYYKISQPDFDGNDTYDLSPITGEMAANRVLIWEPPEGLHEEGFYGQRLYGRNATSGPVQLSLVEAAYIEACGFSISMAVELLSSMGNILGRSGLPVVSQSTIGCVNMALFRKRGSNSEQIFEYTKPSIVWKQ